MANDRIPFPEINNSDAMVRIIRDDNGEPIIQDVTYYDGNFGDMTRNEIYSYNEDNHMVLDIYNHYANRTETIEYNENGNVIKSETTNHLNHETTIVEFNDKGQETVYKRIDSDGEIKTDIERVYNEDGKMIEERHYSDNAGIGFKTDIEKIYNEDGKIIEERHYDTESEKREIIYEIKRDYDNEGNLKMEIGESTIPDSVNRLLTNIKIFDNDGATKEYVSIHSDVDGTVRLIDNHNEEGKMESRELYDKDGKLEETIVYQREDVENELHIDIGDGIVSIEHYDGEGNLGSVENYDYDTQKVEITYFDKEGNETEKVSGSMYKMGSIFLGEVSYEPKDVIEKDNDPYSNDETDNIDNSNDEESYESHFDIEEDPYIDNEQDYNDTDYDEDTYESNFDIEDDPYIYDGQDDIDSDYDDIDYDDYDEYDDDPID